MLPTAADSVGSPTGSVGEPTTTEPAVIPVRPLRFRELLDLPFALLQARIRPLAVLFGIGVAVAAALANGTTLLVSLATGDSDSGTFWGAVLATLLCAWVLRVFLRGVTVPLGLSVVYRRPLDRRGALTAALAKTGPLLRFQAWYTLSGIGVLALGAPLLFTLPLAALWLAWLRGRRCTTMAIAFDRDTPYGYAAAHARTLAGGAEWQLAGLWLYLRGLLLVLIVPLLALPRFVADISGTHRWAVTVLLISAALLIVAVGELVESAAQVVAYVDKRCRREAWDITIPRTEPR